MNEKNLEAISPIDGRYFDKTKKLKKYFSEKALIYYRLKVEVEYFIALCEAQIPQLSNFNHTKFKDLRKIYLDFTIDDAIEIKKIEKSSLSSSKIKETLIREIRIQKQLNHEYICRLYTSFEDKTTIYLALEYASKGNLFYLIRKEKYLSEDTAFYFFIQVCSGIYYLHK